MGRSSTDRLRVMLVDDHSIVRDGLAAVLEQSGEFEVVGEAADGAEAIRSAPDVAPDVIVMDVMMPVADGVEACREIMARLPDVRVLMLTASTEENAVIDAAAAGATGYVHKYSGKEELLEALREVGAGRLLLPMETVRRVFASIRGSGHGGPPQDSDRLTEREQEILALFARGKSYAQIAATRGNSPLTIRNSVYRIQEKLGMTKQEIVVWAVRAGLLDDDPPERKWVVRSGVGRLKIRRPEERG